MSERSSYAPGTPCWVDLGSPDLDASIEFYGSLFGWDVPASANSEATGGYRQAMKAGKPVCGMMPLMQEGQPPAWTSYISVADAASTAAAVAEAGGSVIAEPMEVLDLGTMAVFADPAGAVFGIWQPNTFDGAGVVNEPGALSWNELNTRDSEAAKAFYSDVFGWTFEEKEYERGAYTIISNDDEGIGGVSDRVPAEAPAHWLVYFAVEDLDATLEAARERGGEVPAGPFDISEVGRIAVIKDPWGAFVALIQPDPAM
jgi:uncharacterized protein